MTIQLTEAVRYCLWCEEHPVVSGTGRPRLYCSDYCRKTAHANADEVAGMRPNESVCPACYLVHAGECA